MSEETKEYIKLHMEILKECMKKEGLLIKNHLFQKEKPRE